WDELCPGLEVSKAGVADRCGVLRNIRDDAVKDIDGSAGMLFADAHAEIAIGADTQADEVGIAIGEVNADGMDLFVSKVAGDANLPPGSDGVRFAALERSAVDCIQLLEGEVGNGVGAVDVEGERNGLAGDVITAERDWDGGGQIAMRSPEELELGGCEFAAERDEVSCA